MAPSGHRASAAGPASARTRIYGADSELLAEFPLETDEEASVELSKAGDAVLVAPGGEMEMAVLNLHLVDEDRTYRLEMPGDETADQAIAIDATRVVTLGGGTLRYHRLGEGATGWGRHPEGGYSTLLGASQGGDFILVSTRSGYDLLDEGGDVVWTWPAMQGDSQQHDALAAIGDPRQVQVELLASGDLVILDRRTERRYLIRSPGSAGGEVEAVPADALIAVAGSRAVLIN